MPSRRHPYFRSKPAVLSGTYWPLCFLDHVKYIQVLVFPQGPVDNQDKLFRFVGVDFPPLLVTSKIFVFDCKYMCLSACVYKVGSSVQSKLAAAYALFRAFCRSVRATPNIKNFSRDNLGWESLAKYPEASFKGSDVKVLLQFLVDFMYHDNSAQVDKVCEAALHAARCMDDFLRLAFTAHRTFFSRGDAQAAYNLLQQWHEKTYSCAHQCYEQRLCFFNLTPKFHYLHHVSTDLKRQLDDSDLQDIINPATFSTQMAEDYIGKSCQVARTCHPCTAVQRTTQKWLVHMWQFWNQDQG